MNICSPWPLDRISGLRTQWVRHVERLTTDPFPMTDLMVIAAVDVFLPSSAKTKIFLEGLLHRLQSVHIVVVPCKEICLGESFCILWAPGCGGLISAASPRQS